MRDPTLLPLDPKVPRDFDIVIFDESNPTSAINLIWKEFRDYLKRLPKEELSHYFNLGERELRKQVKPEMNLQLLRMRFWQEYDRCQVMGTKIRKVDLLRGIVSVDAWDSLISRDIAQIAYMMSPPPRYLTRLEAMMNIGIDELGDILTLPNKDAEGKLNTKLIDLKIKIWALMDEKIRGATVQRLAIHQKVETTHVSDPTDLNDLDERLKNVQKQILQSQNKELFLPQPVIEEGIYAETDLEKAEARAEAASDLFRLCSSEARAGADLKETSSGNEEAS